MATKRKYVEVQQANVEPTWDKPYTRLDIIEALKWYSDNKSDMDAAKYLGIKDAAVAKRFPTLAWSKRMKSRGCIFPENSEKTLAAFQITLDEELAPVVTVKPVATNVISIQERVDNKVDEFIGEMEGLVDEFGIRGDYKKMNAYQWMVDNNIKAAHAGKIAEYFRLRSKEPLIAAGGKNAEVSECYASYSKQQLMNLLKCYAAIVSDAEKITSNQKVARSPRKKKPVSFDKLVKGLKYLERDDKNKLQSIDPVKIIGASQLWVYNVKTRKLGVYNALDASGLLVKGSSIDGFSAETSLCKTLRKPEVTLKIVTEGGKIALRKALDSVNSKPSKLNGRINKDTVILRIN